MNTISGQDTAKHQKEYCNGPCALMLQAKGSRLQLDKGKARRRFMKN